ncbi:MAG TPA: DUF262 domain-containing protein [Blastocatellia bacterium]|nr:DUF262 domain-containing protein [Blastocatellia bacterium]
MAQPFSTIMHDIETGAIKIPQFQRNFVWDRHKSARLVDSLLKGYPVGTFIFWKTREELRSIRNLGDIELPPTPPGDYIQYVLDGQQRLTTLFATVRGLQVERDGRVDDFSQMYIDLDADSDQDLVVTDVSDKEERSYISVKDLVGAEFTTLAAFPERYHDKMKEYKRILEGYNFSVILVPDAPIDVATEIFTRINVTGQPLSVFEIMVAKTYSKERNFDLAEKTSELLEELAVAHYGTIPDVVILQAVSAIMAKDSSKKAILKLDRDRFIDTWPSAVRAIEAAVDYFRSVLNVPVSQLLPYKALLVPFAYFFHRHPDRPTGEMKRNLIELFWRVSLGGYYSQSLESRLAADIRRVDDILEGRAPDYDYPVETTKRFVLDNGWFSTGRSFIKAILCILAAQRPRSFLDNAEVNISNDWLKQANSRNYHHFFPRAYLRARGVNDRLANHIGNITLVDDYLNKRKIRDRKPSEYMDEFKRLNSGLADTMSTHLIDLDDFGVWENDYDRFLDRRCEAIARELSARVIRRDIDDRGQVPRFDDFEEIEIAERERFEVGA